MSHHIRIPDEVAAAAPEECDRRRHESWPRVVSLQTRISIVARGEEVLIQANDAEFSEFVESLFEGGEPKVELAPSYTQLGRISRKDIGNAIKDAISRVYSAYRSGIDTTQNISTDLLEFLSDFVNDNLAALHSILCAPPAETEGQGINSKDSVSNSVAVAQMAILIQMIADTFSATFTECFVIAVLTIIFIKNTFGSKFCE